MVDFAPATARSLTRTQAHIVDVLIAERAPRLTAAPWWPLARPLLYRLLDYDRARRMADAIAPLSGAEALAYLSRLLALKVSAEGLERIPREGRCVLVCNHPTGIADGLAVYDAVRRVRPDLIFYANADARRVAPRFDETIIPVEWVEAKRTRERTRITLQLTREAMEAERALAQLAVDRTAIRSPIDGIPDIANVSIGDLVKFRIDSIESEAAAMRDYIQTA